MTVGEEGRDAAGEDRRTDRSPESGIAWLWGAVLLELISPIPALLTFGAVYVLLAKPPWFRAVVDELYAGR